MINKVVADAATKNSWRAVHKWTETVDGKLRIRSIPPILVPYREILSGFRIKNGGSEKELLIEHRKPGKGPERRR